MLFKFKNGWAFAALALLLMLTGCGEMPAKRPAAAAPKKKVEAPTPPPPPKVEVKPDAFANVPEALAAVTEAQKSNDQKTILLADEWIKLQGAAAGPILIETLKNEQAPLAERIASCRAVARLGPAVAKAPLLEALDSPVEQLRLKACESLALMKPHDKEVVDRMISLVDSKDERLRLMALNGLRAIGPAAKEVEPKLLEILHSQKENDAVRKAAAAALKSCAPRKTFADR